MAGEQVGETELTSMYVLKRVITSIFLQLIIQKVSRRRPIQDTNIISLFETASNDDMALFTEEKQLNSNIGADSEKNIEIKSSSYILERNSSVFINSSSLVEHAAMKYKT